MFGKTLFVAALLVMTLLVFAFVTACSDNPTGERKTSGEASTGESTESSSNFKEGTLSEKTREATLSESTSPQTPEVVLRLEGTLETEFRGLCSFGGRNEVLGGNVPERFTFDLGGEQLSCRIQKQGSGKGVLKVILLDGDQTRSVQSTRSSDGTIKLSY